VMASQTNDNKVGDNTDGKFVFNIKSCPFLSREVGKVIRINAKDSLRFLGLWN